MVGREREEEEEEEEEEDRQEPSLCRLSTRNGRHDMVPEEEWYQTDGQKPRCLDPGAQPVYSAAVHQSNLQVSPRLLPSASWHRALWWCGVSAVHFSSRSVLAYIYIPVHSVEKPIIYAFRCISQ